MTLYEGRGRRLLVYAGTYAGDGAPAYVQLAPHGQRTGLLGVSRRSRVEPNDIPALAGEWEGWFLWECTSRAIELKIDDRGHVELFRDGTSFSGTIRITEDEAFL